MSRRFPEYIFFPSILFFISTWQIHKLRLNGLSVKDPLTLSNATVTMTRTNKMTTSYAPKIVTTAFVVDIVIEILVVWCISINP